MLIVTIDCSTRTILNGTFGNFLLIT